MKTEKSKKIDEFIKKNLSIMSYKDMAKVLGITHNSVRMRASRLGFKKTDEKKTVNIGFDRKVMVLQEELSFEKRKTKQLLIELKNTERDLMSALGMKEPRGNIEIITRTLDKHGEVTPIVLLSDFHIEEKVVGATVNDLNEYNLTIAEHRVRTLFQNVVKLIEKERQDSKMENVVVALLGDFISGAIHEPLLPICQLQPMDAILFVQDLLIEGIRFIRRETGLNIIVPCTVGNHSRTTDKVWIATENGFSLEYMMYRTMQSVFKKDDLKVQFHISQGQHQYLEVYGKNFRFMHGTQIRYMQGIGGFTIPAMKKIQKWDTSIPAYYTMMGHLHQFFDANPRFMVNGSLIGYNTYAMAIGAEFQKPVQSFVIVSKKYGKAGVSPIFVD